MTLTLNVVRDAAQQITSATGDFNVTVTGFPAPTTLTGAHIHNGRPGVNAGVIVNLTITGAETALATGAGTITRTALSIDPVVAQNMINDPDGFYFNVHTTMNTGGAIRGAAGQATIEQLQDGRIAELQEGSNGPLLLAIHLLQSCNSAILQ